MKKYPYIGQFGNRILFTSKGTGSLIGAADGSEPTGFTVSVGNECDYKDITREYLQSTWGIVKSKEHAEFIVGLAAKSGFELLDPSCADKGFFNIGSKCFALSTSKPIFLSDFRQITIPLPTPLPLKEKEWPQVGDDVSLDCSVGEMSGRLLALTREYAIISQGDTEQHLHLSKWRLVKPKTPEDLLIEELHQKLLANNCSDEYLLACDIVQGKIEGLSYNP